MKTSYQSLRKVFLSYFGTQRKTGTESNFQNGGSKQLTTAAKSEGHRRAESEEKRDYMRMEKEIKYTGQQIRRLNDKLVLITVSFSLEAAPLKLHDFFWR